MDISEYIPKIMSLSKEHEETVISWRRHLHQHPELSFEEFRTSDFIAEKLSGMGCEVARNVGGTGVVGLLDTKRPGSVVAFRADMDALPVTEAAGLPFASENTGVMHACGHDAHMAILLGLAKVLSECVSDLKGVIKFVFQPGEEANGGARCMIDAGVLENPVVDAIFALHVIPDMPSGSIAIREGYMTATDDEVIIRVTGMGAHSSAPQEGVNAVLIAAYIITAIQTILATQISPFDIATFSICTVKGGEAQNVVPDYAEMTGMLRCIETKDKLIFRESIQKICENTALALGGSAEAEFTEGFPAVNNDKGYTALLAECAARVLNPADIVELGRPHMGSEDFSYYQGHVPGVMFMLGSRAAGEYSGPLHSSSFKVCEDSLLHGVRVFASLAFGMCVEAPDVSSK
ncbi:MAG: M20 family metallopeptidase [Clostridiales bacterium]|nr:M20 family metallopeptidase [Clostridiales bacterium]